MSTATKRKPLDRDDAIRLLKMLAERANWTENGRTGRYEWTPILISAETDPTDIANQILDVFID